MKAKTTITVTVRTDADPEKLAKAIETMLSNLSLEDLELLAKASEKPMLKNLALNELRKRV